MASTRNLLMLGVALAAVGCTDQVTKQAEVRPVRTMVVDLKPVEDDRRAVGEVRPRHESDLGFRVSGKVVSRHVDVGASVKKGDVLARLDAQDYRNSLTSADADVAAAEAVLVEAASAEGVCVSCSRAARRPAPTTMPSSRTCARPRPSSNRPRPP